MMMCQRSLLPESLDPDYLIPQKPCLSQASCAFASLLFIITVHHFHFSFPLDSID